MWDLSSPSGMWIPHVAYGILVSSASEVQSFNHWTIREVPVTIKKSYLIGHIYFAKSYCINDMSFTHLHCLFALWYMSIKGNI